MRVPLSWLRDFAPFDPASDEAAVDGLAAALTGLGLVVEGVERVGEGLEDVVVARVLETRPHPEADKVQLVGCRHRGGSRRRRTAAGRLRGLQLRCRRPGGAGAGGGQAAQRHGDRPPQGTRPVVRGHAVLGRRAEAGHRPRRDHGDPGGRRRRPRPAPRGRAGDRARRGVRPRRHPQPARRPVGGRCGARPRRPLPAAVHDPGAAVPARRPARRHTRTIRRPSPSPRPACVPGSPPPSSRASRSARRRPGWPTG